MVLSLIIVVHVLLNLNLAQQIVAFLEHLRVFAATVRRTVIVVHLVVINIIVGDVETRLVGISTRGNLRF